MLWWYNLILTFAALIGLPFLILSMVKPKRRATFLHRLGCSADSKRLLHSIRHGDRPIWIHALSVGEVISAEPLVNSLVERLAGQKVVLSVSTDTGMRTARQLFTGKVTALFYFPYDLYFSVKFIADSIHAKTVVIVETDIWPNFQMYMQRRGIPVLLVNARLSNDSFKAYRLIGSFSRHIMASFKYIGAQTESDAKRFIHIGAPAEKVVVTGNLKFEQRRTEEPSSEQGGLRVELGISAQRPILLLGSTHQGEEVLCVEVFKKLKQRFGQLLMIVAPRDPGRAESIGRLFIERGLTVGYISNLAYEESYDQCDALVVNTIGILRRLYALADVAFIGGSMVAEGGHNPLEAASFGKPILFGPDMSDFAEVSQKLSTAGGALCVHNERQLHETISNLLSDKIYCQQVGQRALHVFKSNTGALENTIDIILKTIAMGSDKI